METGLRRADWAATHCPIPIRPRDWHGTRRVAQSARVSGINRNRRSGAPNAAFDKIFSEMPRFASDVLIEGMRMAGMPET